MGTMTRLLLLLLWVGVTVSTPVDLQKRIIGGDKCKDDERQYHVKLVRENNKLICGGSLISDRWILTAAHCKEKGMTAVLGLHPDPGQGQTKKIKSQTIFKKWKYFIFQDKHDIMLLELDVPITTITPVNLPDCNTIPTVGTMVEPAGYGATTLGPQGKKIPGESDTLQCVELKILTDLLPKCSSKSDYFKTYGESYLRLYQSTGKDTSRGDSGGGVVHKGMIYGVHVFGHKEYGCVAPSGFVDVCKYKDWIEKTTGLKFPSKAVGQPNSG